MYVCMMHLLEQLVGHLIDVDDNDGDVVRAHLYMHSQLIHTYIHTYVYTHTYIHTHTYITSYCSHIS